MLVSIGISWLHQSNIKHQPADALSRLTTYGHDRSKLNDAILVLMIFPVGKVKRAKYDVENADIQGDVLDVPLSGLPAVLSIANVPNPPTEPSTAQFLTEQSKDLFCLLLPSTVVTPSYNYSYSRNELFAFVAPIKRPLLKLVPRFLQARLLHAYRCPPLVGHQAERNMYNTVRRKVYWPRMAIDVYTMVNNCFYRTYSRAKMMQTVHLKLSQASGPLQFISMDVLGPLPKTTSNNQLVVVITVLYSILTRAISNLKTSATHIASIFYDYLIVPFEILAYLPADNCT